MSRSKLNRFEKSIEIAEKNTQLNKLDNTQENIIDNTQENTIDNTIDNTQENTIDNIINNLNSKILNKILEVDKKDRGSNHTIYLSSEVGLELNRLSKKTKKSKSQIVDDILKLIFFQGSK